MEVLGYRDYYAIKIVNRVKKEPWMMDEKAINHISCVVRAVIYKEALYVTLNEDTPIYVAYMCRNTLHFPKTACSLSNFHAEVCPMNDTSNVSVVLKVKVLSTSEWRQVFGAASENFLFVHPLFLQQLHAGSSTALTLKCFHSTIASSQALVVHCRANAENAAKTLTSQYIKNCLEFDSVVLLNQGTMLCFQTEAGVEQCVIEAIGVNNDVCYKVDRDGFNDVIITTENDLDGLEIDCKTPERSPPVVFDGLVSEIKDLLTSIKADDDPLLTDHKFVFVSGGKQSTSVGCGRSYLANAIGEILAKAPHYFHIIHISCVPLRGKKVETIRESWDAKYIDASVYQPTLIVFDDLDELIHQVDVVQEGMASELHSERLADLFKMFLERIIVERRSISVISTVASIDNFHKSLLPEQNCHLFTKYFSLPDYNKVDVLKKFVAANALKYDIIVKWEEVNSEPIVRNVDGLCLRDLDILANRIFNRQLQELPSVGQKTEISLKFSNFQEDLEQMLSSSFRELGLHKSKPVLWSDIGGLVGVKQILHEVLLWPVLYPKLFQACPIKMASGVLLYGPPGTAKTLLASAVAHESNLNFISVKGPELLNKYVGSSEKNVRETFVRAHGAKPCLVFFDELDSLAPRRGHDNTGVTDRVVNQLLTQLDGVESLHGVYILAATSRPDLIDPALLRPGRFDKCLFCPLPNLEERMEILAIFTRVVNLRNLDLRELAERTENFSGADLKALLYNTQVNSLHKSLESKQLRVEVTQEDVLRSLRRMKPSVSAEERNSYNRVFSEFASSRGSRSVQQKVTHA